MKLFNRIQNAKRSHILALHTGDELRFSIPAHMDAVKTELRWFNGLHDLDTGVVCQLI